MTTETPNSVGETAKNLTELILKGDHENAARLAGEIARGGMETNDVVDVISEAMNIVADLHEVERYSPEQVESCERAAEGALHAIRPGIRAEQRRISGKVMVTSLHGDPHNFDKTLLLTMLEVGGFSALDGGAELSPEEVADRVSAMRPDVLAVPLVSPAAVKGLIDVKTLLSDLGLKTRIVAYGRGVTGLPRTAEFSAVEEDSLSALSKIAEILLLTP
jgi:methanogenic corrinoid protein MtbC1